MSYVLVVSLAVDDPQRAEDAIENGTLIPFLRSHSTNLVAEVIEEDDEDED